MFSRLSRNQVDPLTVNQEPTVLTISAACRPFLIANKVLLIQTIPVDEAFQTKVIWMYKILKLYELKVTLN